MSVSRRGLLRLGALASAAKIFHFPLHAAASSAAPLFSQIPASVSGISWVHENAMSPQRYLPEALGPGCAFLDYDNDGWMDIFLVNSGPSDFYKPSKPLRNALYKNNRDGTFSDVTEKAGVTGAYFGMGVAVGDYDNDGWPDMLVTAYGQCMLYKNNHDGTFTDVTAHAGVATPGITTSAVWFDYDNDGKLDLFICSFVEFASIHKLQCGNNAIGRNYYCVPRVFNPSASFLYHNNGDGTFTEVSKGTAIGAALGKGLGVVATDINNDGYMDLFVANDTVQNFLFVNRGPGAGGKWKWDEIALQAGVGFSESGRPRSGMGVDAADLHGSGYQDLFVSNVDHENYSVYLNNKDESFSDAAQVEGVAHSTRLMSGWGLKYFDYDNDGLVDLILANGHPDDMIDAYSMQVKYKEPLLLYHQNADRKLHDVSAEAGSAFHQDWAARGLAVGDYDNDGALDVIVGVNGGAPVLLKNNAAQGNGWLGLKLEGVTCNRDAIGARMVWKAGGKVRERLKNNGGSYLSSHDPREVLGIGTATQIDSLAIHWPAPSKHIEKLVNLAPNRYLHIVEGKGSSLIRTLVLAGLWLGGVLAGSGKPAESVPQCAGVTLSASYLASVAPDQGPGFRFTLSNRTGHEIRLAQPVPSSAHWYARSNGRWLWRASNGSGGGLVDAGREHGRVVVYPAGVDSGVLIVPARASQQWVVAQKDNPVLAYNPSCLRCSYPGEREYEVIFAYAHLGGNEEATAFLPCGLRSLPVPMPPKS